MKTGKEYIDGLRELKPVAYIEGEKFETGDAIVDHPLVRPSLDTIAMVYDACLDSNYADLLTATSHLSGEKISIFTHIAQNPEDLVRKVKALRVLQHKSGGVCIQRCASLDGATAPYSITYEMDQKLGTEYHRRFKEFVKRVQRNDLYFSLGVTDPKGDRTLRPHQQKDPDMYLRIVRKNKEGIVVRGAKFHQTGTLGSYEKLITPTRTLTPEEKDYAVMFSVPMDAKGLIHVLGKVQPIEGEKGSWEREINKYSAHTTIDFFDDVFVPWENVYMCGEYEYIAPLIARFGNYHRTTYGGCLAGHGDVMTGIAAALAEIHGLKTDPIINDKLTEMAYLSELMFSCGIATAYMGFQTPSGACIPDSVLANTLKINISRSPYEIARLLEDVTGGILMTLPSERDLKHPDLKELMSKYLKEVDNISAEERIRLVMLASSMLLSSKRGAMCGAIGADIAAAGSQQAARVHLRGVVDWEELKKIARLGAGILKE